MGHRVNQFLFIVMHKANDWAGRLDASNATIGI